MDIYNALIIYKLPFFLGEIMNFFVISRSLKFTIKSFESFNQKARAKRPGLYKYISRRD